jgi:FkbM family methyltransferase
MVLFLPELKRQGALNSLSMTICNVGSRKLGQDSDYGSQTWGLFAPNLTIYGFDADPDACETANQDLAQRAVNWQETHLPYALADGVGESTLYVTHNPMCSSLYPPNEALMQHFIGLPELAGLAYTCQVETTTLDSVLPTEPVDFLQIDVQGADLRVLQGATQLLSRSVLAIQIEVEFSPLYQNQPLFAEVDQFLRQRGFMLFDLVSVGRMQRSPLCSTSRPGQVLWADAIYFRDPLQVDDATNPAFYTHPDALLKLACIADILEFTDYATELLEQVTLRHGTNPRYNLANSILQSLGTVPDLAADLANASPPPDLVPLWNRLQPFLAASP